MKPDISEHFKNRVESWFNGDFNQNEEELFIDIHLLEKYCIHCGYNYDEYKKFLENKNNEILNVKLFQEYEKKFRKSTQEQADFFNKKLKEYIKEKEKEKVYYYLLAKDNKKDVIIVKKPSDTTLIKKFLGYEWSSSKGKEGIQYLGVTINDNDENINRNRGIYQINTPLFNPNNLKDENKINTLIRKNFIGEKITINEENKEFVNTLPLVDILDFSRTSFDKTIRTSIQRKMNTKSQFPLENLDTLLLKINGNKIKIKSKDILEKGKYPVITQEMGRIISGYTNNKDVIDDLPLIVFGDHNCTFKYIDFPFVQGGDGTKLLKINKNKIITKFLFYFLQNAQIEDSERYERSFKYLKTMKIPLPPLNIQKEIIKECEKVDVEHENSKTKIEEHKAQIFINLEVPEKKGKVEYFKIEDLCSIRNESLDPNQHEGDIICIGLENIEKNTGRIVGDYHRKYSEIKSKKNIFRKGDILYGKLRPNLNKVYLSEYNGICSTDILVLKINSQINETMLYYYLLSATFNNKVLETVSGQQLPRTSWEKISNIKIPVPPLEEQQKIVSQIKKYEIEIKKLEEIMNSSSSKKKGILEKYL